MARRNPYTDPTPNKCLPITILLVLNVEINTSVAKKVLANPVFSRGETSVG